MKVCQKCHKQKEIEEFYKDKSRADGFSYVCKECKNVIEVKRRIKNKDKIREYCREYRKKNPEKNKEARKRYYQKNKDTTVLSHDLKSKYGIDLIGYNELLEKQGGVCAICGKVCIHKKRLSVDHNHKDGKVRGLLCDDCNNGIARFHDDLNNLWNAILYLR